MPGSPPAGGFELMDLGEQDDFISVDVDLLQEEQCADPSDDNEWTLVDNNGDTKTVTQPQEKSSIVDKNINTTAEELILGDTLFVDGDRNETSIFVDQSLLLAEATMDNDDCLTENCIALDKCIVDGGKLSNDNEKQFDVAEKFPNDNFEFTDDRASIAVEEEDGYPQQTNHMTDDSLMDSSFPIPGELVDTNQPEATPGDTAIVCISASDPAILDDSCVPSYTKIYVDKMIDDSSLAGHTDMIDANRNDSHSTIPDNTIATVGTSAIVDVTIVVDDNDVHHCTTSPLNVKLTDETIADNRTAILEETGDPAVTGAFSDVAEYRRGSIRSIYHERNSLTRDLHLQQRANVGEDLYDFFPSRLQKARKTSLRGICTKRQKKKDKENRTFRNKKEMKKNSEEVEEEAEAVTGAFDFMKLRTKNDRKKQKRARHLEKMRIEKELKRWHEVKVRAFRELSP